MEPIDMNCDDRSVRLRQVDKPVLRRIFNELEKRVRERTAELTSANDALKADKAAQKELIRRLAEVSGQQLQTKELASIGQFAAGVAHEINNPIAFVNSNLGALQRHVEDMIQALSALMSKVVLRLMQRSIHKTRESILNSYAQMSPTCCQSRRKA